MSKKRELLAQCIQFYTNSPALWDRKKQYLPEIKSMCNAKLLQMYKKIDPFAQLHHVKRRFRYWITTTRQELRKERESMKTGGGADSVYKSKIWYVPHCKFLADQEDTDQEKLDTENLVDKQPELATDMENNDGPMERSTEMEFNDSDDESSNFASSSDGSNNDSLETVPPLNEILDNRFSDYAENFNVVHINAQSIKKKYAAMLTISKSSHTHAILVSESFLKCSDPSMDFSLPGFSLIRSDRTDRGAGGVAIYLRSHIVYSIESETSQDLPMSETEHLFLKIHISRIILLLGVYYSPSRCINYFKYLNKMLHEMRPHFDHILIMGDFNTDLIKNNIRSRRLKEVVDSADLHILPLEATHYYPNSQPSLLDLIIVSSPDYISMYDQFIAEEFLYHHVLYLSYKTGPEKAKSKIHVQHIFNEMELTKPGDAAASIDRSMITGARMVDKQFDDYLSDDSDYDIDCAPDGLKEKSVQKASNDENHTTSAQAQSFAFEKQDSEKARNEENPTTSAQTKPSVFEKQDLKKARNEEIPTTTAQSQRSVFEKQLSKRVRYEENPITVAQERSSTFEEQPLKMVKVEKINIDPVTYMNEVQDGHRIWALACATDLANMCPIQRIYAKKAIAEIIMEGQLGLLHRSALQINSKHNQSPTDSQ